MDLQDPSSPLLLHPVEGLSHTSMAFPSLAVATKSDRGISVLPSQVILAGALGGVAAGAFYGVVW